MAPLPGCGLGSKIAIGHKGIVQNPKNDAYQGRAESRPCEDFS